MQFKTSVPDIAITNNGILVPDESDVLAGVMADIDSAFGGGVNPSLSTPQGQLAQSLTAIIGDKNDQIAELVNLVDPDTSSGRWQDAIGRIYFIDRLAARGTVVTGTCIGLVGTVLPAGSIAQDTSGYLYVTTSSTTIPASGSVDVEFQCTTPGPISCPIGQLNTIYRAVTGWDRVINNTAGTEGINVETPAEFEYRRKLSVAGNSINTVQAIYASVIAVPNVIDAFVMDNFNPTVLNYGATDYPIKPHSIYICVAGGSDADIAMAIWKKKPPGCDYNGTTTYTVYDTNYSQPQPSYEVTWVTATGTPIYYDIKIANNPGLPANIIALVKAAVINAFNGVDDGLRARIGATLYAGRYYTTVASVNSNIDVISIGMGLTANPTGTSVTLGIDQRPTLDESNITVELV